MMEYRYVWEKFYSAIYSLVGGLELKERLVYAYEHLSRLKKIELPKDLQVEFEKLINEFCTAVLLKNGELKVKWKHR